MTAAVIVSVFPRRLIVTGTELPPEIGWIPETAKFNDLFDRIYSVSKISRSLFDPFPVQIGHKRFSVTPMKQSAEIFCIALEFFRSRTQIDRFHKMKINIIFCSDGKRSPVRFRNSFPPQFGKNQLKKKIQNIFVRFQTGLFIEKILDVTGNDSGIFRLSMLRESLKPALKIPEMKPEKGKIFRI